MLIIGETDGLFALATLARPNGFVDAFLASLLAAGALRPDFVALLFLFLAVAASCARALLGNFGWRESSV